jgi:hypothetical protein
VLLKDLTIENFRSFRHYKLEGLARVNLLVGDNNSGKTSVLEAVKLLVSGGSLGVLSDQMELRLGLDERHESGSGRTARRHTVADVFHREHAEDRASWLGPIGPQALEPVRFKASQATGERLEVVIEFVPATERESSFLESHGKVGGQPRFHSSIRLDERGRMGGVNGSMYSGDSLPATIRNAFIPTGGLTIGRLVLAWDDTLRQQLDGLAVKALQIIEPSVTAINFSADTETRRDILIDAHDERRSLSLFGEGMYYLLSLAVGMAFTRGGCLVVDEIDTGLHYSRLADMWRMVIQTAAKLNVQVFATTHSLDCLNGLSEALLLSEDLTQHVAVHRIERELEEAVTLTGEEYLRTFALNAEVR